MSAVLIIINSTLGVIFGPRYFVRGRRKTALPPLISDLIKLESRIFGIAYTIIYKKVFVDINNFLMTSSNINFTIGRRHEIQYSVNF